MKISHIEKQEIEIEVIDDIQCNQCGNSIITYKFGNKVYTKGLREQKISCGYGSEFDDGDFYHFSLCESCLKVLFNGFKIPVTKTVAGWAAENSDIVEPDSNEIDKI